MLTLTGRKLLQLLTYCTLTKTAGTGCTLILRRSFIWYILISTFLIILLNILTLRILGNTGNSTFLISQILIWITAIISLILLFMISWLRALDSMFLINLLMISSFILTSLISNILVSLYNKFSGLTFFGYNSFKEQCVLIFHNNHHIMLSNQVIARLFLWIPGSTCINSNISNWQYISLNSTTSAIAIMLNYSCYFNWLNLLNENWKIRNTNRGRWRFSILNLINRNSLDNPPKALPLVNICGAC